MQKQKERDAEGCHESNCCRVIINSAEADVPEVVVAAEIPAVHFHRHITFADDDGPGQSFQVCDMANGRYTHKKRQQNFGLLFHVVPRM